MGAVGGADLGQPTAGPGHDVGHAERAPDLDQLAAREHDLAALGQGVQDQQHGRGVVVDDAGVLGASQAPQQAAHVVVALAPRTPLEIELERGRCAHRRLHRSERCLSEQRATEIGVQHCPGEVEHPPL